MRRRSTRIVQLALVGLLVAGMATPSSAGTGTVTVVFTKAGLVVGVGSGRGVLTYHGERYPFRVSGASFGATIGASTTKFVGTALNLRAPAISPVPTARLVSALLWRAALVKSRCGTPAASSCT